MNNIHRVLIWGDARACPTLLLNSREQATSLYRRSGFVEEAKVLRFTQNHSVVLPDPSPTICTLQESDIPDVAAFDTPYFGANRAKVLTAYRADNAGNAFVNRTESGQITGYMFAEAGSIGPWVASTVEDAEQLLIYALTRSFKRNPSVTIPDTNTDGQHLLERYGFSQQGMNYYMRRGVPAQFRQLKMLYGEASPALG